MEKVRDELWIWRHGVPSWKVTTFKVSRLRTISIALSTGY